MDRAGRVFTTEVFTLSQQDEEVRNGWAQFYDSVRETYVGLVLAARQSGQLRVDDPRRAVDLMLATIEGIKLRAGFEPHVADPQERQDLVDELHGILESKPTFSPAATPGLSCRGHHATLEEPSP